MIASCLGSADHLLHVRHGMDRYKFDFRMCLGEHAEYLIGKGLPYCVDATEIEHHMTKLVYTLHQAFSLRT